MIRRSPGFSAVVILTLALGIGANTAIFSILDALLLRSLPVSEPYRLVQLNAIYRQIADNQRVFSELFAWSGDQFHNMQIESRLLLPAIRGVSRLITHVLFGVSAADPLTFGTAAVVLLVVGILAGFLPARRATRTDPMIALRCE